MACSEITFFASFPKTPMWFIPNARSLKPGPIKAKHASYHLCFSASRRSIGARASFADAAKFADVRELNQSLCVFRRCSSIQRQTDCMAKTDGYNFWCRRRKGRQPYRWNSYLSLFLSHHDISGRNK